MVPTRVLSLAIRPDPPPRETAERSAIADPYDQVNLAGSEKDPVSKSEKDSSSDRKRCGPAIRAVTVEPRHKQENHGEYNRPGEIDP